MLSKGVSLPPPIVLGGNFGVFFTKQGYYFAIQHNTTQKKKSPLTPKKERTGIEQVHSKIQQVKQEQVGIY